MTRRRASRGGECRRAQAAPILVLGEATSALDSEVKVEVEIAIQRSLDSLMTGKTVIAIAQRLSTIAAMDRLIVLDEGRIVEEGTHQQLLQEAGFTRRCGRIRAAGFSARRRSQKRSLDSERVRRPRVARCHARVRVRDRNCNRP
ncbi:Lipid A export ATP-binding/permease protein MsbA [Burkholderia multivorans]|nr:Lipid A export ATP-binding/permease protein MsbA [Burkholderia multivorans]MDR9181472.1 Lipid A export ATP-binding/permease protein MsbA [Burkholderia multivorans]MDR9186912.1 Lipid A export ATP-binding/permease protein MsbA [Burkholderia multivorans]MDR9192369.1 Lipid A export ATP-binding/permease protein MsbA [Burkholderia multivorans]MDR9197863.1 Lipid A export ATP-binding/permease protein MsbA [Burkholderia multivorans]